MAVGNERTVTGMAEYIEREVAIEAIMCEPPDAHYPQWYADKIKAIPSADVAPVRHGRWILQANNERTNYRWNVNAECSECCDEKKEIWAGFFPNVPDWLARDVALEGAKSVKLSNYCPNCGARMDMEVKNAEE